MKLTCSICETRFSFSTDLYPNLVCSACGRRARNAAGGPALHDGERPAFVAEQNALWERSKALLDPGDGGDNPVFIDGLKCWRRYRFGGFVTMRDDHDCETIQEFNAAHGLVGGRRLRGRR